MLHAGYADDMHYALSSVDTIDAAFALSFLDLRTPTADLFTEISRISLHSDFKPVSNPTKVYPRLHNPAL